MSLKQRACDLIGTDWVEHGRDVERDGGLDCYGVLVAVLGLPKDQADALAAAHALANQVPDAEACRAGDVLFMNGPLGTETHVGVAIDAFRFVHSSRDVGVRSDKIAMWDIKCRVRIKGAIK